MWVLLIFIYGSVEMPTLPFEFGSYKNKSKCEYIKKEFNKEAEDKYINYRSICVFKEK